MQQSQLYQQFQLLFKQSQQTLYILYNLHTTTIKAILLFIIAYIAYRMGKYTVSDPLENQLKSMQNVIRNRQKYTKIIPQKISRLKSFNVIIFSMLVLAVGAYIALDFIKHPILDSIEPTMLVMVAGGWLIVMFCLWIYKKVLEFGIRKGTFNDQQIFNKLNKIGELLGTKVVSILKFSLCRDLMKGQPVNRSQTCSKGPCKQYRGLLKAKTDCISQLVDNVLNFDWCSICKKAAPFDQFLPFQAAIFSATPNNEQSEVNQRNAYLIGELQRMLAFCKNLNACNCSMRYWTSSRKQISEFKRKQKEIENRLTLFQSNKSKSK